MAKPAADVHRRLSMILLLLLGGYSGAVAVGLRVVLSFIGRGIDTSPERTTELYWAMCFHGLVAAGSGAAALIVRWQKACGPRRPRLRLLAVVLLVFVSLDQIAGICYAPPSELDSVLEPHPTRGWFHRRGVAGAGAGRIVRINAFGLRGPELQQKKAPGEFRILFLGDSVTFGYGLEYDEIYVTRIGDLLSHRIPGSNVVCLNAGVGGYTTWQELDYLRTEGFALDPDLVIVGYCFNDVTDVIYLNPGLISGRRLRFSFSNTPHWSGSVRAMRSILARRRWRATLASLSWVEDDPNTSLERDPRKANDVHREPLLPAVVAAWERVLGELDAIDELCRTKDTPWCIVAFPFQSQLGPGPPDILPQKHLQRWVERRQVPCLDLLPMFRRAVAEGGRLPHDLFKDPAHPTVEGSRLAAEELARFLVDHKLVPQ